MRTVESTLKCFDKKIRITEKSIIGFLPIYIVNNSQVQIYQLLNVKENSSEW